MVSTAIRVATWSWASHVDFVLPSGRLLGATPGAGVSIRESADADADTVVRYEIRANKKQSASALASASSQIGRPYDYMGIFGLAVRRNWQEQDSWFCSELIAWACAQAGIQLLVGDFWRITPRDLLLSTKLYRIGGVRQRGDCFF